MVLNKKKTKLMCRKDYFVGLFVGNRIMVSCMYRTGLTSV